MKSLVTLGVLAFYAATAVCSENEKMYVKSRDITILNDQIFVFINEQWTPVSGLFSDEYGLYLTKRVGLWFCKACHWHNGDVPNCANCGKPRPE